MWSVFSTVTAVPKRLLPRAQHWIIQADEQTWAAPSNMAPRGTAELQLELRGTPLPPVPLGCVVLQRALWCHLLSSQNNSTNEEEQRMCVWSLSPPLGRAAASDTALGYRVQVTFLSINGVLHFWLLLTGRLWNACPTLSRGESTVNTLCLKYSSQYMKQAVAGGLMSYASESRSKDLRGELFSPLLWKKQQLNRRGNLVQGAPACK